MLLEQAPVFHTSTYRAIVKQLSAKLPTVVSQTADNCQPNCRQLLAKLPTIV
jgi:hypothetical protein